MKGIALKSIVFIGCIHIFSAFTIACIPPYAVIDQNDLDVTQGQTAYYVGDGYTRDGGTASYEWDFPPQAYYIRGDKTRNASCKFDSPGAYEITFWVKSSTGLISDPQTRVVVVSDTTLPWYVSLDGDDDNDGHDLEGTDHWDNAFKTIQMAINSASSGHEIIIHSGTEASTAIYYEQLDMKGKSLYIHSEDPDWQLNEWERAQKTTINSQKRGTAVLYRGYEYSSGLLEGLTVQGGHPADDGLALHLKLDDMSGNNAEDSSGKNRNGTIVGATWTSGYDGGALDFDGSDDHIVIEGFKGIVNGASRTCCAWIKTSSSSKEIMSWGNLNNSNKWIVRVNENGTLRAEAQGGYIYGTTTINNNVWHHIAVVLNSDDTPDISEVQLYVDGHLETIGATLDEPIKTAADPNVVSNVELVDYDYYGSLVDSRIYTQSNVTFEATYDDFGRILTHTTENASGYGVDFEYAYDDNGNITSKQFKHRDSTPTTGYSYDDLNRLTNADYLGVDGQTFNYDLLGNRNSVLDERPDPDTTDTYGDNNKVNEYSTISIAGGNANQVSYDDAGNLVEDHRDYSYIYDYENRLIQVYVDNDSSGGYNGADRNIAEFTYDALGRRIEMVDAVAPTTTRYYYDDQRVLLETDYDGATESETDERYFVYGNYIDEVLAMFTPSAVYYPAQDHLYSTAALFNAAGTVVERYEYDAYGAVTIWDDTFTNTRLASSYGNPYTFTGRRLDGLDPDGTGDCRLKLMYYRARTYDPETGRFMQRDPLEYTDGLSMYEYVQSNPVVHSDPFGLKIDDWEKWIDWCNERCKTLGCKSWCMNKGAFKEEYALPSIDIESIIKSLITDAPFGKIKVYETSLPGIPTPYGTIKVGIKVAAQAVKCLDKNGVEKKMVIAGLDGTAALCIGKDATLSGSEMGYPLSVGLKNNCPSCENGFSGKITLGMKGEAGAFFKFSTGPEVQLLPKTDDPWDYEVEISGEDYIGAQLCVELSAKGTYKKTFN